MQFSKRIFAFLIMNLVVLLAGGVLAQENATTRIRFVHVVPGVNDIDIYVNDSLSVVDLGYGEATTYLNVPAGQLDVRVTLTGVTSTLWEQPVNITADTYTTLVASSTDPLEFASYTDDPAPLSLGGGRFMVIHALATVPTVDFVVNDETVLSDLAYKDFIASINAPANVYEMSIVTEDEAVIEPTPVTINSLTNHILIVYGTAAQPEALVLETASLAEEGTETGFVRFTHGVTDASPVEVLVDDVIVIPSLAYGETTEHLAFPAGNYNVALRDTESDEEIATGSLTVTPNTALTAAAIVSEEDVQLTVFNDPIAALDSRTVRVNVINTTSEDVTVTLGDETTLAEGLAAGIVIEGIEFEPTTASLTVEGGESTDTMTFYGGVYYNILVLNDGQLVAEPTSFTQTIDSAPGAEEAVVVEATEEAADAATEEVDATETATEEAEVEETAVVESTTAPAAEATPTPITAQTNPQNTTPTARVVLDPGANLQLREYPSVNARSLGLIPAGTVLQVNGREGAPVDADGNMIEMENGEEWVDPITLMTGTDLTPSETWLNITYNTPDGGSVTAWVNALYLDVNNAKGEPQRLADLPTVPRSRFGEAVNTSLTPPQPRTEVATAVVTSLDEGVNLNIRRTPANNGEVLGRVASGGELELVGIGESEEWAFVRYNAVDGSIISGWANMQYLRYEFNGQEIDRVELDARNLLEVVDELELRGSIETSTSAEATENPFKDVVVATVSPLDEGISLNLRRDPTQLGEVLANIPSGTRLIVTNRDVSGEWVQETFEGTTGWVSTLYVSLPYNDVSYPIDDVPVNEDITATAEVTTPTATPQP